MKRSQWWLRGVYDSNWYHLNPMSNQCDWTTLNINTFLARIEHSSITAEELLCMHRNQRLLLRGCRDVQYTSTSSHIHYFVDRLFLLAVGALSVG